MAIAFVQNYQDLSTDRGYQFKFNCDHCGNGFMTSFQASAIGMAESALKVAGDLFGGMFGQAGNSVYEVQRMVGGTAHDHALEAAIAECKGHFHQCTRCGKWVCPDVCWNGQANMCKGCAPRFEEEMAHEQAAAKAAAARDQLRAKAQATDYVANVDMAGVLAVPPAQPATQAAPGGGAAFCSGCGSALGSGKFCQQCGQPRPVAAPTACKCGAPIVQGTKFCGECGQRLG
jgi:hypothetical protein